MLWTKTSDPPSLRDGGLGHDALSLYLANGGQRTDEVVRAHLRHALLALGEFKKFFERKLSGLYKSLYFSTTTSIGYCEARGLHALFLR